MSEFDVAIVGGGLVGASLAASLAPTSLRVALIEYRQLPNSAQDDDYDERSIALSYQSKKIFQGLGVWDAIEPHATPINTVHVSEKGRFGVTRLSADDVSAKALGYVVMYRNLAHAASQSLENQTNLSSYIPARLVKIKPAPDSVLLDLETNDGGSQTISARLLVGADGGQSSTRAMLGISDTSVDYQHQAIVANVTVTGSKGTEAYERFTRDGPLALLPLGSDRFALVWTGTEKMTAARLAMDDRAFLELLQSEVGHRVGELQKVGKRDVFPLRQLVADRLSGRRAVLVGNSAHLLHPVAGQGLNLALRDVAVLASLIAGADDPGSTELVQRYAALRQKDIDLTAMATHSLIKIFAYPSPLFSHIRGASLAMLDKMPPLKNSLARSGMGFRKTLSGSLFDGQPVQGTSS